MINDERNFIHISLSMIINILATYLKLRTHKRNICANSVFADIFPMKMETQNTRADIFI